MSTKYVTRIFGFPRFVNGLWALSVEAEDFGVLIKTILYFDTKEEAESITVGHQFIG